MQIINSVLIFLPRSIFFGSAILVLGSVTLASEPIVTLVPNKIVEEPLASMLGIEQLEATFNSTAPFSSVKVAVEFYKKGKKQSELITPSLDLETRLEEGITTGTIRMQRADLEALPLSGKQNSTRLRLSVTIHGIGEYVTTRHEDLPRSEWPDSNVSGSGFFESPTTEVSQGVPVMYFHSGDPKSNGYRTSGSIDDKLANNPDLNFLIVVLRVQ
jgi:hypothetical protein